MHGDPSGKSGLEGIISKRIGSRYVSGRTRALVEDEEPVFQARLILPRNAELT
jgi:hypothetical protein